MDLLQTFGLSVTRVQRDGSHRTTLDGVDCAVASGEVIMLIGPNGAGKSTLLATLSGDLKPSSGSILFDGMNLHAWHARALARRRAVLPQRAALSLPFTTEEIVHLGCLARTEDRQDIADIVAAAASAAGVDHLMGRAITGLSGGEQARVHLARVLAQIWPEPRADEPQRATGRKLLLLDEPCASLDPHHQHAVCTLVRDFAHRSGTAIIITMHDMNLAAQYADRILALRDGKLIAAGTPRQVLTRDFVQHCFAIDAATLHAGSAMLMATRPISDDAVSF